MSASRRTYLGLLEQDALAAREAARVHAERELWPKHPPRESWPKGTRPGSGRARSNTTAAVARKTRPRPTLASIRAAATRRGGPELAGADARHQLAADLLVIRSLVLEAAPEQPGRRDLVRVADVRVSDHREACLVISRNLGQRKPVARETYYHLEDGVFSVSRTQALAAEAALARAGWPAGGGGGRGR